MVCFSIEKYQRPQKVQPINRKKLNGPNSKLLKLNPQNQLTKEETIIIATSTKSVRAIKKFEK